MESLEQIVADQRILRNPVPEAAPKGRSVICALPGENAFAEKVLVDVGYCAAINVDGSVTSVEPSERRDRPRLR